MKHLTLTLILILTGTLSLKANDYEIENIPLPPSKHKTKQIDGLCFMPNGKLVVTLPSGEVYLYDTSMKKWSLFAESLHNPLGVIALSNSSIVVAQRPEITKISDTDGDGKADLYDTLTEGFGVSGN